MNTTPETASNDEPFNSQAVSANSVDVNPRAPAEISPDNPPWGIVAAVLTWLASMAMLAIVPNVCVLPYLAFRYQGTAPTRDALLHDQTFVFLFVVGWLPAHFLTLALVWAIATRLGKRSLKQVFGWSWSPTFGLGKSVGLAIMLFLVTWILIAWLGGPETELDRILKSSRATAVTLAIIAVATAPLVEEMIYRGLLYSAFQRAIGQWGAVSVVAAMFAGLHVIQYWPNVGAITSISLLSLVLTMVRARTGRLLPCFVVHLAFNGVTSVIIVTEPYLRRLFEMWQPKPINSAIALVTHWFN